MNGNYLYLIFFLFFTFLFNLNANNGKKISLSYLASILNKHPSLFASWEYTNEYYSKFLHILIPWMISATDSSLIYDGNPNLYSYDCLNPMYSTFLSGDKLLKPRVIVDFIPFGYDLDKLEIRLYENYEIIDAFIIFESPITQTGVKKPLLFDLVRNTERFSIFSSKIIYLSATKEEMIQTAISLNSKEFPQSNIEEFKWSSENWGLERAMRVLMIKKFQELPSNHEQYDLQQQLLRSLSSSYSPSLSKNIPKYLHSILVDYFESSFDNFTPPLALQNDGDEMILSSFLLHLKNCELSKPSTFPIQPLTYHFKFNLNTLQHEERWKYQTCPQDVASLSLDHYKDNLETYIQSQSDSNSDLDEHSSSSNKYLPPDSLYNYFFIIGPKVDLFYSFLKDNSTLRQHYGHGLPFENTLCLGSGIHMSSIEEPGEIWYKAISTQHGGQNNEFRKVFPTELIEAGKNQSITGELIKKVLSLKYPITCSHHSTIQPNQSTSSKSFISIKELHPVARHLLSTHLPWILKNHPHRYPFLYNKQCYKTIFDYQK